MYLRDLCLTLLAERWNVAYLLDYYTLQLMAEQRMKEYAREIEIDQLLDEIRPHRSNWWSRQICRSLRGLGHELTSLGRRLQNLDRPDARPMRESDAISAALQNR